MSDSLSSRNEEMCLLRSIGVAPKIIAEVFGLCYDTVIRITYGLEPPKKDWSPWSPRHLEQLAELRSMGLVLGEIGVFGFGHDRKPGNPGRETETLRTATARIAWVDARDALLAAAYLDGATYSELEEIFGYGTGSVASRIQRLRKRGWCLPRRKFGYSSTSS